MTDKEPQVPDIPPQIKRGQQPLVVMLLAVIALLLVGVIALFVYQQNQNQQFQRMQAASAYFDKIEQEEKAAAEQERLKAELARAEAARAETARQVAAQQNAYNPCKHVYVGKVAQTTGWLKLDYTVMGFSPSSGKASIRYKHDGNMSEISCSQIPD